MLLLSDLCQVLMYKHDKTGAQLMSVVNSDENKTFGVTFRCGRGTELSRRGLFWRRLLQLRIDVVGMLG